ncbi:MAG: aromatic ring-hydroxylating oxygenase subunit alpha [Alphaproteobacteria bacterium]
MLDSVPEIWTTLPAGHYHRDDIYAREKERIFYSSWFCVGRAGEVENPRDYMVRKVGDESLVVLRDADGAVRAFYNVCPHRGHRVCTATDGKLAGGVMACGYHQWTFGLDGKLVATPRMMDTPGFDKTHHRLKPVAVQLWEGFVFVNLAEQPGAFEPNLGNIGARLHAYNMATLRPARTAVYDMAANWKIVVENFCECFHCPGVHPELCHIIPGFRSGKIEQENPHGAIFREGGRTTNFDAKTARPMISTTESQDHQGFRSTTVYPNLLLVLVPDHVQAWTLWPTGPQSTRVVFEWLFEPRTMARPDFDMNDVGAFMDLVNKQDQDVCERVQEGVQSRAFEHGVYSAGEHLPRKFNRWVLDRLS